jgi:hypothetical protein
MSVLRVQDGPDPLVAALYKLGSALASEPAPSYTLSGMLYAVDGWIFLGVPNALVRGVFSALDEPGAELPPSGPGGRFTAHITVFRPDEVEKLGGIDAVTERGKRFRYTLGRLVEFRPEGWKEMEACWAFLVHSPELQELRRSYGLSSLPNEGRNPFHITVAVRRKGVLGRNDTSKGRDEGD